MRRFAIRWTGLQCSIKKKNWRIIMNYKVILRNCDNNKIHAIKVVREVTGCGLAEAKTMVERTPVVIYENSDKYAANEVLKQFLDMGCTAVLEGDESGEPVQKSYEYAVILKRVGPEIIKTIKEVREITGLGLREAKDLVDNAPATVINGVTMEEAQEISRKLNYLGNSTNIIDSVTGTKAFIPAPSFEREAVVDKSKFYRANRCPKCGGTNAQDITNAFGTKLINSLFGKDYSYKCGDCKTKW